MAIIGRRAEMRELEKYYDSGKPELLVVYGRRRVGKTYLIREYFDNNFTFYFTGSIGAANTINLANFDRAILKHGGEETPPSKNWTQAFAKLEAFLRKAPDKRKVVFIDEMPWLDTRKSGFLQAFDYFWNSWASANPEILFICCGSATSWITNKLFKNRGGLHNRVTGRIYLEPFTISECEQYFQSKSIVITRYQLAECYMILGGIPYYLNLFDKGLSFTQNIDRLCFAANAPLGDEFDELYRSLFTSPNRHIAIIETLAKTNKGLSRNEICQKARIRSNGHLTETLKELEQCGFVERYIDFTTKKKGACYFIKDPFSLFFLRYMKDNDSKDEYFWTNSIDDGGRRAWSGYAFEQLCRIHMRQIKMKLGVSGVSTSVSSWRSKNTAPGSQIDLLISRKDGVINLCEIKYAKHPFEISKDYAQQLEHKKTVFLSETGTRRAVHITMITTYGLAKKGYFGIAQSEVTLEDLFV